MFDIAHYTRHKMECEKKCEIYIGVVASDGKFLNIFFSRKSFGASKMAIKMEIMQRRLNVNFCVSCEIYFFPLKRRWLACEEGKFCFYFLCQYGKQQQGRNIIHTLNFHFAIKAHILFEY